MKSKRAPDILKKKNCYNSLQLSQFFYPNCFYLYIGKFKLLGVLLWQLGQEIILTNFWSKKYADEKVDNHDAVESMVNPEKMLEAMNDVAAIQRNMFMLSQRLSSACYAINAKAARYQKREVNEG